VLIVIGSLIIVAYVILNFYFVQVAEYQNLKTISYVFAGLRAFGLSINATLLSSTIWKLKSAKVNRTETGHLKIGNASMLLVLQILMIASGLLSAFIPFDKAKVKFGVDMFSDIIDYMLCVMYFKMITNFITTFRLQTKVNKDGSIDIVGIDENGHEVFKFNLDNEQHQNLLGFAREQLSHQQDQNLYEHLERNNEKNKFEVISDIDSHNDFTDGGASGISASN